MLISVIGFQVLKLWSKNIKVLESTFVTEEEFTLLLSLVSEVLVEWVPELAILLNLEALKSFNCQGRQGT